MSGRPSELKLCGLAAVRARFQRDAGSIQRLYFDAATGRKLGIICKALAAGRKIYRTVDSEELEKIAGSIHHGGVVAVVPAPVLRAPLAKDVAQWVKSCAPVLLLDRIGNAHNLGAIARSAAFFGVQHLILPSHPSAAVPNDAAYRIAEGGLEHLSVWRVPSIATMAGTLASAGYEVIGAATRGGSLVTPASPSRLLALALGNEEQGLAPEVAAACTRLVTITGGGQVESLNVSVAAAVLMHALLGPSGKRA